MSPNLRKKQWNQKIKIATIIVHELGYKELKKGTEVPNAGLESNVSVATARQLQKMSFLDQNGTILGREDIFLLIPSGEKNTPKSKTDATLFAKLLKWLHENLTLYVTMIYYLEKMEKLSLCNFYILWQNCPEKYLHYTKLCGVENLFTDILSRASGNSTVVKANRFGKRNKISPKTKLNFEQFSADFQAFRNFSPVQSFIRYLILMLN